MFTSHRLLLAALAASAAGAVAVIPVGDETSAPLSVDAT
jgi:hypothetical protein